MLFERLYGVIGMDSYDEFREIWDKLTSFIFANFKFSSCYLRDFKHFKDELDKFIPNSTYKHVISSTTSIRKTLESHPWRLLECLFC